jgi:galactokinase
MIDKGRLKRPFRLHSGSSPRTFQAPGRVNIIGEHTDYNDGFVMPAAIGLFTRVAAKEGSLNRIRAWSDSLEEAAIFDLNDPIASPRHDWSDYVRGVAVMLERSGYVLRDADLWIEGHIPMGSGLGSSAALEVSTAIALVALAGLTVGPTEIAQMCQRAENEFVGARSGIMDQFACCHGRERQAIFLDCRSLKHRYLPLPESVRLLICNTMTKHALVGGEYNIRRQQCEDGFRILSSVLNGISALRDVTIEQLERSKHLLDDRIYLRCAHVIEENERVQRAAEALQDGDVRRVGMLMNASHESLRDKFEVSSAELDLMVTLARKCDGVYGSRMTGGGFGGCTVSLVDATQGAAIARAVTEGYLAATDIRCDTYLCSAVGGAKEITMQG